jgi:integrase
MAPVKGLFATALEEGLIRSNSCAKLRLAGARRSPENVRTLSEQELGRLLDAAPDDWRRFFSPLPGRHRLRIREAIALRWSRVDLAAGRLRVTERLYRGQLDAPKSTYGTRTVPLSPGLVRALAEHGLHSAHNGPEDYVFATSAGSAYLPENLSRRVLSPPR